MSRKHFQAIANVIAGQMALGNQREQLRLVAVAEGLASEFRLVNPRFDRRKFLLACGVDASLV